MSSVGNIKDGMKVALDLAQAANRAEDYSRESGSLDSGAGGPARGSVARNTGRTSCYDMSSFF